MILSRRDLLAASAVIAGTAAWPARAASRTLRMGYQPYGNLMLLKVSGILEKKLKPLGWDVTWSRFVSGPPMMEALAANAIDYGSAGETPPVFAQAAGARIVYHGAEPPASKGEAILVQATSPIKTAADLKGKKIALTKGANVHYLFVKAIAQAGLDLKDVTPVYLAPADERAAFERGSVDAWAIWDPFLAAAQASGHTRTIEDGTGLVANHQYYLGNQQFTEGPILDTIRESIREVDKKTIGDPGASAAILSPEIRLPEAVVRTAVNRQSWDIQPMDGAFVEKQQAIADTFFKLGLIGRQIRIADALPKA